MTEETTLTIGSLMLRRRYGDVLPPLSETEYAGLREDIRTQGRIQQPIVIDEDGVILEGHNRAAIAAEIGLSQDRVPIITIPGLSEEEKLLRVVALNLNRRHLGREQKCTLASQLRQRNLPVRKIALVMGESPSTVMAWLTECSGVQNCTPEHMPVEVIGRDGKSYPSTRADVDEVVERRREARTLRGQGKTTRQIADEMKISVGTVQNDLKVGTMIMSPSANRAAAVVEALPNVDDLPATNLDPKQVFKKERQDNLRRALEEASAAAESLDADDCQTMHGDFRHILPQLPDESVELILTDPPYAREFLPLYGALAEQAMRLLVDGGSLIAYAGNYALPEIIESMAHAGLRYWWTLGVEHASQFKALPGLWVYVGWKPLVWFVKGGRATTEYVFDMIRSPKPEKAIHDWEQGEKEAAYLIERLTIPGQTVLDPMCGSGTTIVAARDLGRRCIGIDIDVTAVEKTRRRMGSARNYA